MLGTEKHRCVGRYNTLSSYHRSFCLLTALDISRGSKTKKRRPLCWNQGISCSRGEVLMSSYSLHALLFRHLQMHFIINPRMHSIVILLGLYYAGPVKISVSRSQGPPSFFFFFFVGGFRLIILQNVSPSFHLTNIHMNLQVCCTWK